MSESDDPNPLAAQIAASVHETLDTETGSRRRFLTRSALAGGTLLALGGGGVGLALGREDDSGDPSEAEMTAMFDDVQGTDIDVLNYALTLERLEDAFYRHALETFDQGDFAAAEHLQSLTESQQQAVFANVQTIGEHESAHVEVLAQAVQLLGGEPVQEATYDFGLEDVDEFLELGRTFENTGAAAYAGAAAFIESPDLLTAAASILSVEARHAAYLNGLTGVSPFPDAFDPALSQREVLDAVSQFIVSGDGSGGTATPTSTPTDTESV